MTLSRVLNVIRRARPRDPAGRPLMIAPMAMVALIALVAAPGCGGGGKPAYCSDRSNLNSSVKGLTNAASSAGLSGLQSQLTTIKSDATSLVNSAKSDFPTETSAITSSVDTLDSAVKALPANPSSAQVTTIATDAAAVVSSVKSFSDATSSKCS
jgi:hypothetical protein